MTPPPGPRPRIAQAAGEGLVIPVAEYRIGTCRRREYDAPLVCLELTGRDEKSVRYGIPEQEAFALAVGILRRLQAQPFGERRVLAGIATKLVDELTTRSGERGRG